LLELRRRRRWWNLLRDLTIYAMLGEESGFMSSHCVHQLKLILLIIDQLQTRLSDYQCVIRCGVGIIPEYVTIKNVWFLLLLLCEKSAEDISILILSLVLY